MAETFARSHTASRLSELLAQPPPWSLSDRLILVRSLAEKVRALHRQGRTHRAIRAESVTVDDKLRPRLDPPALPQSLGGEGADPEQSPPELLVGEPVLLPESIEAAKGVVANTGHAVDPRRIDIYQIGTLLCRLLTGETMLAYMYDPTIKAKVPAAARVVLQRSLGEHEAGSYEDCDELIEALDEAVRHAKSPSSPPAQRDTPAEGSVLLPQSDTPPEGRKPAAPPEEPEQAAESTVERLAHYRVLGRIGSGGMGDVYRGYDESLDRDVAIKVLPPELGRDKDFVKRFHQEATAAAKIRHPNIVPIYFCGEDAGHHFFAMQHIEGESLAQRLARDRHLSLDDALAVLEQCLAGLHAAHENGLIHRDIKPGNVLMEQTTGRAVVVDFGLVRRMGSQERMTATGMVMGTVDYIAPEQARGQEVDARADIYSLGVLFYQLLSGRLPFKADTPTAMIFQHAYEDPYPLAQAAASLPAAIYQIVDRMMAKDPARRYTACADVLADVEAFREGRALAPGPEHGGSRSRKTSGPKSCDFGYEEGDPTSELAAAADVELPPDLDELADNSPLRRVRDFAATIFRRHAPDFVQNLQSTTQQVDGAVAHYERRRNRLAKLLEEARGIEADLAQQKSANEAAAAAATDEAESSTGEEQAHAALDRKQEFDEQIAAVQTQLDQQREQVEDLESQLAKADATLARLRSQHAVLQARMGAAGLVRVPDDTTARQRRRRKTIAVVGVAVCLAGLVGVFLLTRQPPRPSTPAVPPETVSPPVSIPADATEPDRAKSPFDAGQAQRHQEEWAEYLGVPVEYTNSIGMKFRLIPPGEFSMGSTPEEQAHFLDEAKAANDKWAIRWTPAEGPQHQVRITKPFYLGVYEVTQEEYERVTGKNPSGFSRAGKNGDKVPEMDTSRFPVESVSWGEAVEFCRWLSAAPSEKSAGRVYRLPTEAEWEHACRAGTITAFQFGSQLNSREANCKGEYPHGTETTGPYLERTTTVRSYQPNAFGLYDMHGNVWEWCRDWHSDEYYNYSESEDPAGAETGWLRVSRGGCWFNYSSRCRAANRSGVQPGERGNNFGFRVALVPVAASGNDFRQVSRSRTSGQEALASESLKLDYQLQEHSWRSGDPLVPLIPVSEGFCVLTHFGGEFEGPGTRTVLTTWRDGRWYLGGYASRKSPAVKATSFTDFTPQVFRPEVSEYRWNHPDPPVKMLHESEGVCLFSGFSGPLEGSGEAVRVSLDEDGYWYLSGKSAKSEMQARAIGLHFVEGGRFGADVTRYSWRGGDLPVKMIHRTEGFCGLATIGGGFEGGAEQVRLFVGEDDYWYLFGNSAQRSMHAEAVAVRILETGEVNATNAPPPTPAVRGWPRQPPGGSIAAGQWVDLAEWIDVDFDTNRGDWTHAAEGIQASWLKKGSETWLPVILGHNYDVELDVTLEEGEGVVVVLPANENTFNVFLGSPRQGLQWAGGRFVTPTDPDAIRLMPGQRHKVLYSVRVQGNDAQVDVTIDGQPLLNWSGSESSLSGWNLPIPRRPKLGVWSATATFHTVRVRDLDGETVWIERTPID